jgi:D-serine deaminase-like pyridoxal phosphate-dependent protein
MIFRRLAQDRSIRGQPGSRALIDTPALVLDLDAFEANLQAMAARVRAQGLALRPHAKTHKCAEIARRLSAAGAVGHCVAKLGEAEALADAGIEGLLITSAVPDRAKIERLAALAGRSRGLMAVVEDAGQIDALAAACAAAGQTLVLLIDVDVGTHRFGIQTPADAVALAGRIAAHGSLALRGIQGYAGHIQSMPSYRERRAASHAALARLGAVRDALIAAGHPCPIVSGGGTGTHDFDHEAGVLTELQLGSYVFSDVIYDGIELAPDGGPRLQPALFVQTRIVSAQHAGFATSDAGFKSFAMDGPPPKIRAGAPSGARYERFGDEFGKVVLPDPAMRLKLGDVLECIVPHCDPTVNLFDHYHCVRGDRLVDIWRIEARGCTS